ncbi:MAG TPA: glycoside hydrolase family 97 catalytic domain-containing protein [Candidatus Marinimicrobia bacterium]|nr:glycoside hydrolase family 97 catalytic domain-containing protein [Candidatus Neomarinimicrobiota bacterium]HRU92889.1 glycoside hydrolase family 97 catalytic domain-containing protein [Candidatus Neomarinimicrobiota bacterium]
MRLRKNTNEQNHPNSIQSSKNNLSRIKAVRLLPFYFLILSCTNMYATEKYEIKSPDAKITVNFWLLPSGEPVYSVNHSGQTVILPSKLGIVRSDENFATGLKIDSASAVKLISDQYTLLHGKRINCSYTGNRRVFYLSNANAKPVEIIFQISNDGVAFRYYFPEKSEKIVKIYKELSSYHFDRSAKAFLQPCADARTGWCFSQPSYEEFYNMEISVGTPSPYQAGWVLPALFNYGNFWISITETAVDTNYCGSRLSQFSPDGEYSVQFPQPQETRSYEPALPESSLPWYTPWRVIVIANNLAGLVESTLETDLANPAKYDVSAWLKPGIASWSWVILKDDSTEYFTQKRFIDFAASMKWQYCLIDAYWDTKIGYEKIKELADYARTKNVKIILWYNSAGDWNTTSLTPRDKLLTKKLRQKEFQRLKDMGISGIKVDFFGGDGQSMMKYYIDILKDAADYNLAVNFHGSTSPRSWYRTYPNLVSMEAIRGEEYVTFTQEDADHQPSHCTVIPFTRNLFDPMDFTPVNFSGIPNIQRRTTNGFEIALSVIFTSGIQHIAETPSGMAKQPDFVKEYMSSLPQHWDDVKFIDGYPGKFVVIARKAADKWYIAGINGEKTERTLTLNIPFINKTARGTLITDAENANELVRTNIKISRSFNIKMKPNGGFVIVTLPSHNK